MNSLMKYTRRASRSAPCRLPCAILELGRPQQKVCTSRQANDRDRGWTVTAFPHHQR